MGYYIYHNNVIIYFILIELWDKISVKKQLFSLERNRPGVKTRMLNEQLKNLRS